VGEPRVGPPAPEPRIREALRLAREAMDRAYAPYSGFHVGAAIVAGDGIFTVSGVTLSGRR